ncbi:hypothetical protein HNO53_12935 [Billgrantia antri]|uniref:Uncharacterized protein n=1 Tax=Halomonas sulfidivorans TaxID=2733488 RepID=A0ABX7WGK6_9GAMM|nr:hypothetical protein [Halomonas sulfidivorans]QTP59541.1 hypothetical protein HNO53_12935 [Halomonas sulfidivorans]
MSSIIAILRSLLAIVEVFIKQNRNEAKQQEVKDANEDPTAWFNDHFNADTDSMHNNNKNPDTSEQTKNNSQ